MVGRGKAAHKETVVVRPGKPWSLPSVCQFEKPAIKEIYGGPWEDLDKILFELDS
jgi:hypothetical protein